MAVSRNEAERDAHISESVSNLDTVLFSVDDDVDQCAVKIFLAEFSTAEGNWCTVRETT